MPQSTSRFLAGFGPLFRLGCGIAALCCGLVSKSSAAPVWVPAHYETVYKPATDLLEWIDGHYDGSPKWVEGTDGHYEWVVHVELRYEWSYDVYENHGDGDEWAYSVWEWMWVDITVYEWVEGTPGHWEGGDWIPGHYETVHTDGHYEDVWVEGHWEDDGT